MSPAYSNQPVMTYSTCTSRKTSGIISTLVWDGGGGGYIMARRVIIMARLV